MGHAKAGPFVNGGAPALNAGNMNVLDSQYDDVMADIPTLYIPAQLPPNVTARTKRYDPAKFLYNGHASNLRAFRDLVANARSGGLARVSFIGDSKVKGLNASAPNIVHAANSWPARVVSALEGRGVPVAGTGFTFAGSGGTRYDDRFTLGTGWSATSTTTINFMTCTTSGATLTYAADRVGTIVEILTLSNSAPFQYRIDGGSWVTVTPSGSNVVVTVSVTGLSSTLHTVDIQPTTSSQTYILAVGARGSSGLLSTNEAIIGSTATDWANNSAWYYSGPITASIPATCAVISLGINDMRSSTLTAFTTGMTALITQQQTLGRAVALVVPTPAAITDHPLSAWWPFVNELYNLADSFDLPLVDLTDQAGTWEIENAAGKTSDNLHESPFGYAADAEAVLSLFQAG